MDVLEFLTSAGLLALRAVSSRTWRRAACRRQPPLAERAGPPTTRSQSSCCSTDTATTYRRAHTLKLRRAAARQAAPSRVASRERVLPCPQRHPRPKPSPRNNATSPPPSRAAARRAQPPRLAFLQFEYLKSVGRPEAYEGSWVQKLNQAGLSVTGIDLPGCGRSEGLHGYVDSFQEDFVDSVLQAAT